MNSKKRRNHTAKIVKYSKLKNNKMSIGVRGRYGTEILGQFSLGIVIDETDWDAKERFIKDTSHGKYESDVALLYGYKKRLKDARNQLAKGTMVWDGVEQYVLDLPDLYEDEEVLEFANNLEQDDDMQWNTIDKHITNVNAVQNHIGDKYPELKPLLFSHFNDAGIVKNINDYVVKMKLASETRRGYLLSLQKMWRLKNNKDKRAKLFSDIPPSKSNPTPKKPVTHNQLLMGYENINTMLQFEAYVFWLYSMSLIGLDGIDLINLDESNLAEAPKELDYYHPDIDFAFGKKQHIRVVRSKNKKNDDDDYVVITRLWNLFPIMYLKQLLSHCIQHTRPELAYKGKDRLKVFNFYTRDKDRNQIREGIKTWKAIQHTYSDILSKKLGATLQNTRATSSELAQQTDVSETSIDTFLGHSNSRSKDVSKALKHYLSPSQLKADTEHIFILHEFDLIQKIDVLVQMFGDRTEVINNKEVSYIPEHLLPMEGDDSMTITEAMEGLQNLEGIANEPRWDNNLMKRPLTQWTKGEEMEFQSYVTKYNKPKVEYNPETKKMEQRFIEDKDFEDRFKELLIKKYKPVNDTYELALKRYEDEKRIMQEVYNVVND